MARTPVSSASAKTLWKNRQFQGLCDERAAELREAWENERGSAEKRERIHTDLMALYDLKEYIHGRAGT